MSVSLEACEQAFSDCLRLRYLATRQTLTRQDRQDLESIADRLHGLAALVAEIKAKS